MRVTLIQEPKDILSTMWTAARTCYSALSTEELDGLAHSATNEHKLNLISKVLESGHLSIAEHVVFTFGIDYVSRSLTHQLVRHRLCTFSQQSQRYVNFSDKEFHYVIPESIRANEELSKDYKELMTRIKDFYDKAVANEIKAEDARYVLPNAACTNIVVTTNLRNLMHMANLRLCTRAQWEIRAVFKSMVKEVTENNPWLKQYLQPTCEIQGFCTEHNCCGRKPKLDKGDAND